MSEVRTATEAPKISIIVPAYNAERTIERCVQSLQQQDIRELEILVVSDCSPDRSAELATRLAIADRRISVLTTEKNSGVHGARRVGVLASRGRYIGFADADDFVQPHMYRTLLERLERDNACIAICSAALVSKGRHLAKRVGIRHTDLVTDDILTRFCRLKFGSGVLWNKLYKREVIIGPALLPLTRDVSEDYLVNFGAFAAAKAVALEKEALYNWVAHETNATGVRSGGWPEFARMLRTYVVCLEQYAARNPALAPSIDQLYLKQLHYPTYRMRKDDRPAPEMSEHIATSLHRLAEVSPLSIHTILHSLPQHYSRLERVLFALKRR